ATAQDSLEEIVVVGSRASLASALEKRRNSDKVIGVVDSDAIGNFADINVAESLRRISGIMVENDQGEGRYVTVRGMNTDLNAMTINGVSTAAPEDRRGMILDGVPSDLLDSMTVYKTLTPNLDADTIGGAIDLETITAFSYDSMFVRLKAETSYNELTEDSGNPSLAATFSNRWQLNDGEFGAAVVLSDQSRRIVAHNNENGGWGDSTPNDDYEMRYYDLTRDREGIVVALNYRADSGNSYFMNVFHNEYSDVEWRAKWETRDGLEDNDAQVSGSRYTYADGKVDTESKNRTEVREITSLRLGGEFIFSENSRLEAELFASEAEQDDRDRQALIFRSKNLGLPFTYYNSDPKKPVVTFPSAFYDPSNFPLKAFEREFALNTDEDSGAKVDFYYSLNNETDIQLGAKVRSRRKVNEFNFCEYEPVNDILLSSVDYVTPESYLNSVAGPTASFGQVTGFIPRLGGGTATLSDGTVCPSPGTAFEFGGDEEEESIPADWVTEEDILAAYAMATTQWGDTTLIYGLRYEDTDTTYYGKAYDGTYAGVTQFKNDYGFLAPSLNVKFNLADDQIVRVGVFRSMVRPGFQESAAGAIVDTEDNEIEGGNPSLNPTSAWNFDLSYEWYLSSGSFFGAGIFYKDLRDAIVAVESEDTLFRGAVYDVAGTWINTDNASITGAEVSFQQTWENGLLFSANYTLSDGETNLPSGSVYGERAIPFFKQAKHTGNITFGYNKDAWDVRLTGNYRSSYLDDIGDDALSDRYTDDFFQLDLTARYQLSDDLLLTGQIMNLNDAPEYYYFGNDSRLSQYDEYGSTVQVGLRYSFGN
ncbi:MAG: TonB-dependent receptor, partial [Pseudohongiellaceae bacterium]